MVPSGPIASLMILPMSHVIDNTPGVHIYPELIEQKVQFATEFIWPVFRDVTPFTSGQ
jgi:hypothetical protein